MISCHCESEATIIIPHGFAHAGKVICGACARRDYLSEDETRSIMLDMVTNWPDLYPGFAA